MKKLFKKLILTIALVLTMFSVTACDDDAPYITVETFVGIREKVTIDFTIWDEDGILSELTLTLTGKVDGESYSTTTRVTITGGNYATEEDLSHDVELDDFIGEKESESFSGLDIGEEYQIVFTGTYNDKSKKIYTTNKIKTSGEGGTKDAAHQIETYTDLNDIVRNDPDGYFELVKNIDCEGKELIPLFSSSKKFVGDFDGKGFTISNFYQDSYDQYLGLFGYVDTNGSIYDLDVKDVDINSLRFTNLYIGTIAGRSSGEISNVTVSDCTITTKGPDDGDQYIGGFVGYNRGKGVIENCSVTNITLDLNVPGNARIGGFAGTSELDSASNTAIINCTSTNVEIDVQIPTDPGYNNDEEVELELAVGGFIGDNRAQISGCEAIDNVVLVYVDGTDTDPENDKDYDENNPGVDQSPVNETERKIAITQMKLSVGGFAGKNLSGTIIDSSCEIESINVEVAYLDFIHAGGFVGLNDYFGLISSCSFTDFDFNVVVSEDTSLPTGVNSVINSDIGLNNSYREFTFSSTGTITFTVSIRVNDDGEYSFEEVYSLRSAVTEASKFTHNPAAKTRTELKTGLTD